MNERRATCAGLLTAMFAVSVYAGTLTEHMDIACAQNDALELNCSFRLLGAGELSSVVAELNSAVVEGVLTDRYPAPEDTTAIMILVDTSDPARQPVIEKKKSHVGALLGEAGTHHAFGMATFDTDLYVLAPMGTSGAEIQQAANGLRATGKTTELYRNVREAVRMIGQSSASRKVLVIMSDGLAEDYAYHHDDVVSLAREHGVIINSIGYPRSVAKSVALQTIRRLSDETGGAYVQANHVDYSIPQGFFKRMLVALDSGGKLAFDLSTLAATGAGPVDLSLAFQTTEHSFLILAPVVFPGAPGTAGPEPTPDFDPTRPDAVETTLPAAPTPPPLRPAATVPARPIWPWFIVLVALLVVILATVMVLFFRVRRQEQRGADDPLVKPLAYLIASDGSNNRHIIDKTPWRIGRSRNNDLTLSDHSVSRIHAEIRSNDEGALSLNDLESLNGVFVNDNRIESIQLREGDAVDIGDVRLSFTLQDENYADEDATVLVRTHAPT